jgi:large subunit ribosomal protein L14
MNALKFQNIIYKMIQQQTILKVADNSGAKTVKCIKILGGFKKNTINLGDSIIVSIQKLRNKSKTTSKVKKKEVTKAIIIGFKKSCHIKNGFKLILKENSVVLINKQGNPIGTRIMKPVPKKLRNKKFQKLASISAGLF